MLVPLPASCGKWVKLHLLSQINKVQCFHYTTMQNHSQFHFHKNLNRERDREREKASELYFIIYECEYSQFKALYLKMDYNFIGHPVTTHGTYFSLLVL